MVRFNRRPDPTVTSLERAPSFLLSSPVSFAASGLLTDAEARKQAVVKLWVSERCQVRKVSAGQESVRNRQGRKGSGIDFLNCGSGIGSCHLFLPSQNGCLGRSGQTAPGLSHSPRPARPSLACAHARYHALPGRPFLHLPEAVPPLDVGRWRHPQRPPGVSAQPFNPSRHPLRVEFSKGGYRSPGRGDAPAPWLRGQAKAG